MSLCRIHSLFVLGIVWSAAVAVTNSPPPSPKVAAVPGLFFPRRRCPWRGALSPVLSFRVSVCLSLPPFSAAAPESSSLSLSLSRPPPALSLLALCSPLYLVLLAPPAVFTALAPGGLGSSALGSWLAHSRRLQFILSAIVLSLHDGSAPTLSLVVL